MFQLSPQNWIEQLNQLPPELIWVFLLGCCFVSILLFLRIFGAPGLFVYSAIVIIAANLQVLKAVQFSIFPYPVALGTVLFSSSFLCTDILNEYYGPAKARKAVWLGFSAYAFMTMVMLLGLAFRPLDSGTVSEDWLWAAENHEHLSALFTPTPALLVAGMVAYLCSQFHDVWIYQLIKRLTGERWLWFRNNVSTALSALVDSVIFSVLAWRVFAAEPLPWSVVLSTYILGTYSLRLAVALLDTPIIYLAKFFVPKESKQ